MIAEAMPYFTIFAEAIGILIIHRRFVVPFTIMSILTAVIFFIIR